GPKDYDPALDVFCQAEDGIRDGHVTGVQTCALPILFVAAALVVPLASMFDARPLIAFSRYALPVFPIYWAMARLTRSQRVRQERSEERRVGKDSSALLLSRV